eukprot:1160865-Pelagomonas_calceolata.AAC.10
MQVKRQLEEATNKQRSLFDARRHFGLHDKNVRMQYELNERRKYERKWTHKCIVQCNTASLQAQTGCARRLTIEPAGLRAHNTGLPV